MRAQAVRAGTGQTTGAAGESQASIPVRSAASDASICSNSVSFGYAFNTSASSRPVGAAVAPMRAATAAAARCACTKSPAATMATSRRLLVTTFAVQCNPISLTARSMSVRNLFLPCPGPPLNPMSA